MYAVGWQTEVRLVARATDGSLLRLTRRDRDERGVICPEALILDASLILGSSVVFTNPRPMFRAATAVRIVAANPGEGWT